MDPLIVLFSTQYRTWEYSIHNHVHVIKWLANHLPGDQIIIIGIHCWSDTEERPPQVLLDAFPKCVRYSISIQREAHLLTEPKYMSFFSYVLSTELALDNARSLYKEMYSRELPRDAIVVRLRPDVYIASPEGLSRAFATDLYTSPAPDFYFSMYNSNHRPWPPLKTCRETSDAFSIAPHLTMSNFLGKSRELLTLTGSSCPFSSFYSEYMARTGVRCDFLEAWFYAILTHLGTRIVYAPTLKIALVRSQHVLEKLTYETSDPVERIYPEPSPAPTPIPMTSSIVLLILLILLVLLVLLISAVISLFVLKRKYKGAIKKSANSARV